MTRPRCGNDPRAQLTDDDRRVVEDFKAYLADRAALRDRIADALADAEGWQWAPGFNKSQSPTYQGYLRQADAVLAVLLAPADRDADEVDADTVANRAAQVITAMGADVRELKHSRDRYRAAWRNARRRAAVLSAEITRRAPLLGEYAAQIANLRTMYAASEARVSDLIDERDQLATDYAEERAERKVVQDKAARARAEVERLRADRAAVLTDNERQFLRFALDLAFDRMVSDDGFTDEDEAALKRLRRMADETPAAEASVDLPTLAAALDGLDTLIATSSRDWGTYRVDAWLWAVLCGWDCEEDHEHDDLCEDGEAMTEMARQHGWDEATVAKARRYRAAVRAVVETQQDGAAR